MIPKKDDLIYAVGHSKPLKVINVRPVVGKIKLSGLEVANNHTFALGPVFVVVHNSTGLVQCVRNLSFGLFTAVCISLGDPAGGPIPQPVPIEDPDKRKKTDSPGGKQGSIGDPGTVSDCTNDCSNAPIERWIHQIPWD